VLGERNLALALTRATPGRHNSQGSLRSAADFARPGGDIRVDVEYLSQRLHNAESPGNATMNPVSIRVIFAVLWVLAALPCSAAAQETRPAEELAAIEKALPARAFARPRKPRKLLIFDVNVVYGGHPSRFTANEAFLRMGRKTGAFEAVISRDPAVFAPESLKQFDAVFLNNTVGNLFEDPALRRSLMAFVTGGGGLMGVHGTSVGFTRWPGAIEDWPEFGRMLGARGAAHLAADEPVMIRLEDPAHPVAAPLGGKDFQYADEFFRFGDPFSRNRVRVLLSIDNAATARLQNRERVERFRADDDYALAWVRNYGRGRVFYSTIGHNPKVFTDPLMLRFYLAATQFVLGDLDGPTVPSARLSPAVRAQEKLGWRFGIEAYTFHRFTFFETVERTAALGLPYVGGLSFQRVSSGIAKNLDPDLTDDELEQVRAKLDEAGLRLLTYYIQEIPGDEAGCRKVFEFGRKLGIETFLTEPKLEALDTIDRFAQEYGINVGLHNHDQKASPHYWSPDAILKVVKGRSKRIGACADIGYWMRAGIDPIEGIRKLRDRLITIQMHDLHARTSDGYDVPWGTGAGRMEQLLREMHRLNIRPTMFGLEYSRNFENNLPEVAQCVEFFNRISLELAAGRKR
jgi:type 1 glutamine amidotransferase/sugar phosphate isomerase/epimerase